MTDVATTDFTIQVGESNSIRCHSFVLAARWEYFRTMLSMGGREFSEKTLCLPPAASEFGLSLAAVRVVIEFCYTGSVSDETVDKATADDLLCILSAQDLYFLQFPTPAGATTNGADFSPLLSLLNSELLRRALLEPSELP